MSFWLADPTIIEGHTGTIKTILLEEERQNLYLSSGDDKEIRFF